MGLGVGAFCLGCGCFFACVVYVTIMQHLHDKALKGNPATFLMVAPISVASLAVQGLAGSYGTASKALLGMALFVLSIVAGAGPKILAEPSVLGVYWAYVFPLAALATSAVANAEVEVCVHGTFPALSCLSSSVWHVVVGLGLVKGPGVDPDCDGHHILGGRFLPHVVPPREGDAWRGDMERPLQQARQKGRF